MPKWTWKSVFVLAGVLQWAHSLTSTLSIATTDTGEKYQKEFNGFSQTVNLQSMFVPKQLHEARNKRTKAGKQI